jgi:hypothetical protein
MIATKDPSTRFVLPADHPYVQNLSALWSLDPKLARAIESPPTGWIVVQPSRAGPPTLSVQTDGRTITLHSKYNPRAEAQKLIESIKTDGPVAFYLLGLGLGYHLQSLFEKASREALFFIFEPDLGILAAAMEHNDLSEILRSNRALFFTTPDKADLFLRLTPHAAMCSMGLEGLTHAPSLALHPDFYRQIQEWLTEFAAFSRTSLNTLVLNGRRTAENITRNIALYAQAPSVAGLKDSYKGEPAIIVSAGPSLRKNKHLLLEAQGHAVIIAVQTILQPLLDMGIEPHFVTSLDYHDISIRYYEKLPRNLKTQLVAEPKASPKIFDVFPGPIWTLGNQYADSLLRELTSPKLTPGAELKATPRIPRLSKARLPSGATVAHLAYYLAEHLACDPIIFIGQDLGFSDGLAYTPGTNIDDVWAPEFNRFCTPEMRQWEFIARERPILRKIPDHQGRPMYTEERLFTYLQQFERDFLRTRTRIIDASEGGARKRAAAPMSLRAALDQYCKDRIPNGNRAACGLTPPRLPCTEITRCLSNRIQEAAQIEQISQDTLPLLEEVRDHLHDQTRVNRAIARIDLLRARMDQLGPTYDLITQLTQSSELNRFHEDRKIAAQNLTGPDLQRRQIDRDIQNVKAIAQAARQFSSLLHEVCDSLQLQLREVA